MIRGKFDAGESAAILAKELGADLVLIDERAATRKARALGLRVVGTLGVLLLGKRAASPSSRWAETRRRPRQVDQAPLKP